VACIFKVRTCPITLSTAKRDCDTPEELQREDPMSDTNVATYSLGAAPLTRTARRSPSRRKA
jgi:hypothetical protein